MVGILHLYNNFCRWPCQAVHTNHWKTALLFIFFNCYLAAPRPTLGHYQGDSLTHPMLIIAFFLHFQPEGHREPRNKVGSLSPAERLVGFELGTFQFLLQCLNPLGHSYPNLVL